MTALLRIEGLTKRYRGVTALDGVSLDVLPGSITGLVGPNGSGKSTLFDCVTCFQRKDAGAVWFAEQSIGELGAHGIARLGVRRTFQQTRVFPELSVLQNLLTAAQSTPARSMLAELCRLPEIRAAERAAATEADRLLHEVGLADHARKPAGGLSYGQAKLVELAMSLMGGPRLVLLDEPVAGINPTLIEHIKQHLLAWRARGISFLLIEHNLRLVFDICDWVYVLDQGSLLTGGPPAAVAGDPRVIEAYLGSRKRHVRG